MDAFCCAQPPSCCIPGWELHPGLAPCKPGRPQCEHKTGTISVVGLWCLCQNPEFLIASFESRVSFNKAIKLCLKSAF